MQQFMLKQFERPLATRPQTETRQLLLDYFARLVDEEIDRIWVERNMNQTDLDKALRDQKRTSYN